MNEETLVGNIIKHRRVLQGMLTALVGDAHVAEDLFQEVAIVMTRRREETPDDVRFVAWGRAIAVNVARDWRKRQTRRPTQYLDPAALDRVASAFEEADDSMWEERRLALERCAEGLPESDRRVLRLRYDEAVPVEELAASMSLSRGAFDTMLYRLRKSLQSCVESRLRPENS